MNYILEILGDSAVSATLSSIFSVLGIIISALFLLWLCLEIIKFSISRKTGKIVKPTKFPKKNKVPWFKAISKFGNRAEIDIEKLPPVKRQIKDIFTEMEQVDENGEEILAAITAAVTVACQTA